MNPVQESKAGTVLKAPRVTTRERYWSRPVPPVVPYSRTVAGSEPAYVTTMQPVSVSPGFRFDMENIWESASLSLIVTVPASNVLSRWPWSS
ncbi:MAG: hypothetical protein M3Q47_05225 [Actinomycetota bacterium]|nr:hypothetical protein [Actinomycetota bacterium]